MAAGSFAVNAGSAVAGHAGQAKASKANKDAALRAMVESWKDIGVREVQEMSAASQEVMDSALAAGAMGGTAKTSAAEAGVDGISVHQLFDDIQTQASRNKVTIERNRDMAIDQLQREKESGRAQAAQRIAAVPPPSGFLTALRVGGAAVEAGNFYYSRKPTTASKNG
jgi:hypothetical protein